MHAFMEYYPSTLLALLHSELNRCKNVGDTWLSRLLEQPNARGSLHPIQHILAIHFLGSTIEEFFSHHVAPPGPFGIGPWPCLNPVCESYQQKCVASYKLGAHSTAMRPVGVFACTCGFTYTRSGPDRSPADVFRRDRIISYGAVWETRLRELWANPALSVSSISRHLGARDKTANRRAVELCLPFPRETRWTTAQVGSLRHRRTMEDMPRYRSQWLALLHEVPGAGRSTLKKRLPGVHKWLWTHDREWLMMHLPPKKQP